MDERRRTKLLVACLAGAALVAGCSLFGSTGPGSASRQLADHIAQWQAKGPDSYAYTITMACFCPFNEPFRVTVENNVTTAVTSGGVAVNAGQIEFLPKTVPALFKVVSDNLAQPNPGKLTVSYDAAFGFPTSIDADPIANAIDDEFTMTVTDFTPAP